MTPAPFIPFIVIFGSVALATAMLANYFLRRSSMVERRLRDIAEGPQRVAAAPTLTDLDLKKVSYGSLDAYAKYVPKSPKEMSSLRRRLAAAGFNRPEAAIVYGAVELALPLVAGATALSYVSPPTGIIVAVLAAAIAYMLPGLWLGQKLADRRRQIQNGLADALDLLLISMEAGSGLDQAMMKVSSELHVSYPALAEEFHLVISEIRAGRPRTEALRQLADRTKVEDVRSLVAMLLQTDRFGTSVGQALRVHADVVRTKRRQRAEERAQKLGVKLVFPLVLCLFPAMYVIVLGPPMLKVWHYFGSSAGR